MTSENSARAFFLTLAVLLCMPRATHAAESYDNCTGFVTSIPSVITAQGTWCLKQDLTTAMTSGTAITVNASNVTLDCNDFKLGDLAAGTSTTAVGIYAQYRSNITVRHCNIRGFYDGLRFFDDGSGVVSTGGHVVEDNVFMANTRMGLQVDGDGSVVRRNRVLETGGSSDTFAYGITTSHSVDTMDNTIAGVSATYAYGIYTTGNPDGSITGNRVREIASTGSNASYGIMSVNSVRITLRNNDVIGSAASNSIGMNCYVLSGSSGHAKNNVINGFATGISGCSDDGGNVIAP
jgi:hypothetical protein